MKKTCEYCDGTGDSGFWERDYSDEDQYISFPCEYCNQTGLQDIPSLVFFIKTEQESFILDIEVNINRPSNPDIDDIIDTYMKYNYGNINYVKYIIDGETIEITKDWNIENYI